MGNQASTGAPRRRSILRRIWDTEAVTKASVVVLVLAVLFYMVGMQHKGQVRNNVHWKFWLQVVTSNWSPDQPEGPGNNTSGASYIGNPEYMAGTVLAIVVNLGAYAVLIGALKSVWNSGWRRKMELKQAFLMRDGDIQADIVNYIIKNVAPALGEDTSGRADLRKGIETIFYNANRNLPEDVKTGWGEEGDAFLKAHGDQLNLNP